MAATPDLTKGPVLLAISVITELFALSTCVIRFCVRKRSASHMGLDDYSIAVAAVVSFVGTIFSIIEGSAMVDSSHALEFDWLGQPWFMMGTTFAKISVCLFFIRLVGPVKQWRILLSSQILLMAVVNFAFSLTTNLQCRPLEKLWNPAVDGVCWDPSIQLNIGYFQGAFSVFWWLFLSLFPVMIVRDLEVHQRMRWPFYLLSSLSLMAAIFATVRTYETSQTVPGIYTFDTFFAAMLAILEQNIGIVAANLLPMGSLLWTRQRQAAQRDNRHRSAAARRLGKRLPSSQRDQQPQQLHFIGQNPFESGSASLHSTRDVAGDDETNTDSELIIEGPRKDGYDESRPSTIGTRSVDGINGTRITYGVSTKKTRGSDMPLRAILNRSAALMGRASGRATASGASSRRSSFGDANAAIGAPQEAFWPRGIIKTVEVEVVEEDIAALLPMPSQHRRAPSAASGAIHSVPNHNTASSIRDSRSRHSRMGSDRDKDNDWASLLRAGPTPPVSRGPSRQGHY